MGDVVFITASWMNLSAACWEILSHSAELLSRKAFWGMKSSASSYNRLFLPFMFGPLDLICSWTEPDGCRPSAISPEPMCVRWMKFVGSPIIVRSILLLLFFGGGLATTQQLILCQKSLMPTLSAAALQAGGGTAAGGKSWGIQTNNCPKAHTWKISHLRMNGALGSDQIR